MPTLKNTLTDSEYPDRIKFNPLYAWFQKITKEAEELEAKNAAKSSKGKGKGSKPAAADEDDED